MSTVVTLIPGDGIGPSITAATVKVLEAADADVEWDERLAGVAAVNTHHTPIPEETLESIKRTRVSLKGPLTTPVGTGFRSINVALRKEFDLYANVRPALTLQTGGRYEDIDLVLIRENTEGLYVGVEHYIGVGDDPHAAAESVMIITRFGAERIVRYAFEYAVSHGRKKVTLAHKANILKFTQGLFLDVGRAVAKEYEGRVEFEDRIIDATAMLLVLNPYQFDVLVMENMFGDILSDQMAGLVGGLGMAPGGNIGSDAAIFEPVHGSAPDIAGQGKANPLATFGSVALMLRHSLQMEDAATAVESAMDQVLEQGLRTPDLASGQAEETQVGTAAMTQAVIDELGAPVGGA
jgi:isocitrate dehydrogenase (NAD+)